MAEIWQIFIKIFAITLNLLIPEQNPVCIKRLIWQVSSWHNMTKSKSRSLILYKYPKAVNEPVRRLYCLSSNDKTQMPSSPKTGCCNANVRIFQPASFLWTACFPNLFKTLCMIIVTNLNLSSWKCYGALRRRKNLRLWSG